MEAEEKHSSYNPSQKKKGKEEKNKKFLDKLDKAMEAEEKHSGYKPSQKKEVKSLTDQEIFENNLKKALKQEEKIVDIIHQENKLEKNHLLKMISKIL